MTNKLMSKLNAIGLIFVYLTIIGKVIFDWIEPQSPYWYIALFGLIFGLIGTISYLFKNWRKNG